MIDGVQGGEWRVLRDVKGMWHVPVQFGAGQSWIDKKIDVGFWGSEKDTLMTGKSFIAKVQEEWKRATCLSVDFFDDESGCLQFLSENCSIFLNQKCDDEPSEYILFPAELHLKNAYYL